MNDPKKRLLQSIKTIFFAIYRICLDEAEVKHIKSLIQDSYTIFAQNFPDGIFFNLGIWDQTLYNEYRQLPVNFSTLAEHQNIYSPQLWYYLIRPLIKSRFLNKRLLDIGSGHGIGLKASSIVLDTSYALGVDLVSLLVTHANANFYVKDKVNYIQGDAEYLALPNESFDIITNLESSHVYPKIERFFAEVERVLAPGGFFCYADIEVREQPKKLEEFLKTNKKLKIIIKRDITKLVQASIYRRIILNEEKFYQQISSIYDLSQKEGFYEAYCWLQLLGVAFLPWWKIRFKNPLLNLMAKEMRKTKTWIPREHFYYYLIQKEG